MKNIFVKLANDADVNSLGSYFRRKRAKVLKSFLDQIKVEKIRILDIGGRSSFWNNIQLGDYMKRLDITIVNIEENRDSTERFKYIAADARDLPFLVDSFEVVFSNSVIEHVVGDNGVTFCEQQKMANEILRVGKKFYVQTPNYWFPMEPHFMFPFFQWLPISIKAFLLRNFNLGWHKKIKNKDEAIRIAKSIRLLTSKEMNSLFPDSNTYKEIFFGLTKSITKYSKI